MRSVVSAFRVGVTLSCLALLASACNDSAKRGQVAQTIPARGVAAIPAKAETPAADPKAPAQTANGATAVSPDDPLGYYVGMFVAEKMDDKKYPMLTNKINVSIDSTDGDRVVGHSVVAGTSTPFTGTMEAEKQGVYDLKLTEAQGKDSGVFTAVINMGEGTISGTWVANDKNAAVTKRSYELVRTTFKYNPHQELGETLAPLYNGQPDDGEQRETITDSAGKINASARLLKTKDVENMYKGDLEVARNAIYARHGYTFRNRRMREFFDSFIDWYVPVKTDVTADLTDIEKKNIELLKRYEKHADKYYDSYGR
jgi:hypothetical protein